MRQSCTPLVHPSSPPKAAAYGGSQQDPPPHSSAELWGPQHSVG